MLKNIVVAAIIILLLVIFFTPTCRVVKEYFSGVEGIPTWTQRGDKPLVILYEGHDNTGESLNIYNTGSLMLDATVLPNNKELRRYRSIWVAPFHSVDLYADVGQKVPTGNVPWSTYEYSRDLLPYETSNLRGLYVH